MNTAIMSVDQLPPSLQEVAQVIGLGATLRLVEHWGGLMALYVPQTVPAEHQLASVLGLNAARKLAGAYGGDYLRSIPRCARAIRAARDNEMRERHADGVSAPRLALQYGMTERQVWNILGRKEGDDRQIGLL